MERLVKRYNEHTGTYEYVDVITGAGFFDSIMKKIPSTFIKNAAKTVGTKVLEAGVSKFGSEIGERAANKIISSVKSNPKETIDFKPLGDIIIKELSKNELQNKTIKETPIIKPVSKSKYYGYGLNSNKKFQSKLNKLLK